MYQPSPAIPPGLDPSDWLSMVEAVEAEARRILATTSTPQVRQSLRILQANLAAMGLTIDQAAQGSVLLGDYFAPQLAKSHRMLLEAQDAHAAASAADLEDILSFPIVPNTGALAAAVSRTRQAITADWERLAASAQAGVVEALRGGMVAGQNPKVVARRIAHQAEMSYDRGLTIARTEMADLYGASRSDTMTRSERIDGWWWRARPDGCAICQAMHGEVFPTDEPRRNHHQCRCVMVPHVPGITDPPDPRTAEQIEAKLPKSWPKGESREFWRGQVAAVDNPSWRPSYRMRKPTSE